MRLSGLLHNLRRGTEKTPEGGKRCVMFTRIWDRKAGKLTGKIENATTVGPGPTKTTMVLARANMPSSLKIHDAASGKTWELANELIRPIIATSEYILYTRFSGRPGRILYHARIVLGK